jgi:hypothetical protein
MNSEMTSRQRFAIDASVVIVPFVIVAIRPGLIRRDEWALRPVRRFIRRLVTDTVLGFAVRTWAAHSKANSR